MAGPTDGPSDEPSQPSHRRGPTEPAVEPTPGAEAPPPELELLTLRDGLPEVVETPAGLAEAVADLAAGTGPIAIDAERASGYRYSARAYLIQLRRAGSTSWLIDPIAFDGLAPLREVLDTDEWILHAASQDLACLREVGLEPPSLFDTELAARLLGHPRVGLAALVEEICGKRMRKEHSAADWSVRPLPRAWLDYAALDVELLGEIRDVLAEELREAGKQDWARQEFEHVLAQRPVARTDPWRRTSQMHKARGRRGVAVVRELWIARDRIAERRDVSPGRIIPDSAIVAAANAHAHRPGGPAQHPRLPRPAVRSATPTPGWKRSTRPVGCRRPSCRRCPCRPTGRRRRACGPTASPRPPLGWPRPVRRWASSPSGCSSRWRTC